MADLAFRTVAFPEGQDDDQGTPRVYLVRDESEWPEVAHSRGWHGAADGSLTAYAHTPDVDLAQETAVVVFLGVRPTTGYGLAVDRLSVQDGILVVEATETLPGPTNGDMITYPMRVLAVRPSDLPGDEVSLRLRVVEPPPEPEPTWGGCWVLVEKRPGGGDVAIPEGPEFEVAQVTGSGEWILVEDLQRSFAETDDELVRWSPEGRVVRFVVQHPFLYSRATLWDGGELIWEVSYEAGCLRPAVTGEAPFDLDAWAAGIFPPDDDERSWFFAPHVAVDSATGWLPRL